MPCTAGSEPIASYGPAPRRLQKRPIDSPLAGKKTAEPKLDGTEALSSATHTCISCPKPGPGIPQAPSICCCSGLPGCRSLHRGIRAGHSHVRVVTCQGATVTPWDPNRALARRPGWDPHSHSRLPRPRGYRGMGRPRVGIGAPTRGEEKEGLGSLHWP